MQPQPIGLKINLCLVVSESVPFSQIQQEPNLIEQLQPGAQLPLAYYGCSVDAKGRLKVPADYVKHMNTLGAQFFLTSYDELDIHIYTRDAFLKQCSLVEELALNPELQDDADDTLFRMRDLGADVSLDTDGRFQLPPVLRQRLGLTELPSACHIGKDRDHFVVMTAQRYAAMRDKSRVRSAESAKRMRQLGLR